MEDRLPTAVHTSSFHVYGVEVKCHVLDDGRRIIDADSVTALFKAMADPNSQIGDDGLKMANWMKGRD